MIIKFAHKGLKKFYETDSTAGIQAKHAERLDLILELLNTAESPADMDIDSFRLHPLKGNRKGIWSVFVNGNWRVTFRFIGKDVELVNYEDYH